jgi:chromosome segregation ATPase
LQDRSRLLKQLEENTKVWRDQQAIFEAMVQGLVQRTSELEEELRQTQAELEDTKVLLRCAEQRADEMSASIDLTEATMEEAKDAIKGLKGELAAALTGLENAKNAKLALQARLKASEVRFVHDGIAPVVLGSGMVQRFDFVMSQFGDDSGTAGLLLQGPDITEVRLRS